MDIDAPIGRDIQDLLWQDLPESHHHDRLRRQLLKDLNESLVPHLYRLIDRDAKLERLFLYRGHGHHSAPAFGLVRLGDHRQHLMALFF